MVVINDIIPFKGFTAMNLYGIYFFRRSEVEKMRQGRFETIKNHESIHTAQMKDFALPLAWFPILQLAVGGTIFYILYLLEWIWQILIPPRGAYRWISFEREAYMYQQKNDYLANRKHFAQWKKSR